MRHGLLVCLMVGVMSVGLNSMGFGQDAAEKKEETTPDSSVQQPKKEKDENTPEGVVTKFLNSVAAQDKEGVKSVALPDDDLDVLFEGEKPTPAQLAQMQVLMALSPMKRLKVGDEITLPGGRKLVIDETRVNKNRQSISAMGSPVPFDVQLIEGKWKVNAQPMIASRKAVKKALERKKENKTKEQNAGK